MKAVKMITMIMIAPALYPDVKETWDNDLDVDQVQIPLEEIKVPTFVQHGRYDALVPIAHGQGTANRIPNCEFLLTEDGCHVSSLNANYPEILDKWVEFLKKHL